MRKVVFMLIFWLSDGFDAYVIMYLYVDNGPTFPMNLNFTKVPDT